MTRKEQFIAWLNDAYSTEIAMIPVLQNHAADAEEYPEIRKRDLQHLEETRRQAEQLKNLIQQLGGKVSTSKTILGKIIGMGQSVSTEFFSDQITKNFLADYAAEHFEIASYKALIATAEQIGEHQCIPVLEGILREEEAMARWIEEHLPLAVRIGLEKTTTAGSRRRASRSTAQTVYNAVKPGGGTLGTILIGSAVGAAAIYFIGQNRNKGKEQLHTRRDRELDSSHTAVTRDASGTEAVHIPPSSTM